MAPPRVSALLLALSSLSQISFAQIDIAAVAEAGPPPTPSIAINVPSQVVKYEVSAVITAAAAEQSEEAAHHEADISKRWAPCDPQWLGKGPVSDPDTVEAFQSMQFMKDAAMNAPVPRGYKLAYQNLNASANALGYMGYTLMDTYDTLLCAQKCDVIDGCAAININFERAPSLDPSPPGGKCDQPPSTNLIKCVFWGGPVSTSNAVNDGQWRNGFRVVVAGANGYTNQTVDGVTGYTPPGFLGSRILNPPKNCNDKSTLVSNQYWNDGKPFDTRRCAAACSAQLSADPDQPCYFFNTYIVNKNGQPQGQYCAMYSQQWSERDGTQNEVFLNGDRYTFTYSYHFTNLEKNGLPCKKVGESPDMPSPPSTGPLSCPESDGRTFVSNSKTFLIECGKDYSGNDMGFVSVRGNDLNACIDACAKTDGCVNVALSGAACYLKRALGNPSMNGVWGAKLVEGSSSSTITTTTTATTVTSPATTSLTTSTTTTSEQPSTSASVSSSSTTFLESTTTSDGMSSTTSAQESITTSSSTSTTADTTSSTSTTADTTSSTSTTADKCAPTAAPGTKLTEPGCDALWVLQGASEDEPNLSGIPFSARLSCGSIQPESVAVFVDGNQMYFRSYNVNGDTVNLPNGIHGPVTLTFMALDTNGYPFVSTFDLLFGGLKLDVSVVDGDESPVSDSRVLLTSDSDQAFTVTRSTNGNGIASFENLPDETIDVRAISPDGRVAFLNNVPASSGSLRLQFEDFYGTDDGNWDFSGGSKNGWEGAGEIAEQNEYPALLSRDGPCMPGDLFCNDFPWFPWLPGSCDGPDFFFGCFCFGLEQQFCGLDFFCDGEICLPHLPCCQVILLKDKRSGGSTLPHGLIQRQAAGGSNTSYVAVTDMNKFIGTLVDTVQVRNGSEVQDVSPAVKQNVSSILTTLSEDPKVAPADKVAGEEPVANITRRDTSLSLAPRRLYFDPDLFIKTDGEFPVKNTASFILPSDASAMYVRFKFSTSEFERLQLPMRRREDSSHDDSYSVTVRSDKGDVASKTGSVMRSTFNFYGTDYRSTDWILLRLPLTPGSTKAQIVMTVQNKGDSSYDSALIIDKAGLEQEGTCKATCAEPEYGTCSFYSDCMESKKSCSGDPSNFALGIGQKNCNAYTKSLRYSFSGVGQTFAGGVSQCIQKTLLPLVNCDATCQNLAQAGLDAQKSCYTDHGFCAGGGFTCRDYASVLMTLGHQASMHTFVRQLAVNGANCAYSIKSAMDNCYPWQLTQQAKEVVWAAYFGTSYSSLGETEIEPCGDVPITLPPPPPTPEPEPEPEPEWPPPSDEPVSPPPGDTGFNSCSNVGQCGTYSNCGAGNSFGDNCVCGSSTSGMSACFRGATPCLGQDCNVDSDCDSDSICLSANSCCGYPVCSKVTVCQNPQSSQEIFRRRRFVVRQDGSKDEWTATHRPGTPEM